MDFDYPNDINDGLDIAVEKPIEFESSFTYHAIPLDEIKTLDENGIEFTLKDLIDLGNEDNNS